MKKIDRGSSDHSIQWSNGTKWAQAMTFMRHRFGGGAVGRERHGRWKRMDASQWLGITGLLLSSLFILALIIR
jgi:hypothetical protein